ncbi:hypothetical protein [Pandoraea sp.]|uniref:hypothetical protein n=1 Tax=Pandoraea sp. TaxID=1883445 RepID=UPI0025FC517D|nr:hypothetical protein [Pandoraea sp.]
MDLQREFAREAAHEFDLAVAGQLRCQLLRNVPASRLEGLHALGAEVGVEQLPVTRVLRRIHAIGNGEVGGGRIAECLRILEHSHDVRMPEQRPVQIVAAGDRAAAAHFVIGGRLIFQDAIRSGIPIIFWFIFHVVSRVVDTHAVMPFYL